MASRILAAIFGGYLLASGIAASLPLVLPMRPENAVPAASMLGYLGYAAAVLWAFSCRKAWQAWLGILVPAGICLLVVWFNLRGK
ncbi:MAG: DUF3649 domain-containing protein [Luteolibacter sp.]